MRNERMHEPCHASWLNQIEIYFSIVQRKVLTPNDFAGTAELADRLRSFESHFAEIGKPFEWTFTPRRLGQTPQEARLTVPGRCGVNTLPNL